MKKIRIRFFNINLGPYSVQGQDINIKYHPSLIDRVFEMISALMVIAGCVYFVVNTGFENNNMLTGFCLSAGFYMSLHSGGIYTFSGENIAAEYCKAIYNGAPFDEDCKYFYQPDACFQCIVHQFSLGKSCYRNICNGNVAFNNGLLYFCYQEQIIKT